MRTLRGAIQVTAVALLLTVTTRAVMAQAGDTVVELKWDNTTKKITNATAAETEIKKHAAGGKLTLKFTGASLPTGAVGTLDSDTNHSVTATTNPAAPTELLIEFPSSFFPTGTRYNLRVTSGASQLLIVTWNQSSPPGSTIACESDIRSAAGLPVYWDDAGRVDGGDKPNDPPPLPTNRVKLRFGPDGRRVSRLPEHIDANDEIVIYVIAPVTELANYNVEVVSGEYAPAFLNIYQGGTIPPLAVRESTPGAPAPCNEREFNLGRFTSGTLVIRIVSSANPQAGQTHTLRINPLYHGTIRLGVVGTSLDDPTFGVLTPAGGTAQEIFVSDQGDRVAYVIEYVPFILTKRRWAGRDILKPPRGWDRLNLPVVGFAIKQPTENIFVGFNLEVARGVALTGGFHYGKRTELADGFRVGSTFAGTAAEIPTSMDWKGGAYYGVSLDLFIIGKAFQGIFSGGK